MSDHEQSFLLDRFIEVFLPSGHDVERCFVENIAVSDFCLTGKVSGFWFGPDVFEQAACLFGVEGEASCKHFFVNLFFNRFRFNFLFFLGLLDLFLKF